MAVFTNTAATTAAVANRFVLSTSMSLTPYAIANASPVWSGGCLVTIGHTIQDTLDTLGTITIVGTDLLGQAQTEILTPSNGITVTGAKVFRTVTSATSLGWVIGGTTADLIVIGCAAGSIACAGPGKLYAVVINTTAAATVVVSDGARTIATLKASIAEGTYLATPAGIEFSSYLMVATTSTNNVTVIHSQALPQTYATT